MTSKNLRMGVRGGQKNLSGGLLSDDKSANLTLITDLQKPPLNVYVGLSSRARGLFFLSESFFCSQTLCTQEMKAVVRLGIWAGSPGPLLLGDRIRTKFSCPGPNTQGTDFLSTLTKNDRFCFLYTFQFLLSIYNKFPAFCETKLESLEKYKGRKEKQIVLINKKVIDLVL